MTDTLGDPSLDLYHGSRLILSNDNWKSGIPPNENKEPAILITLDPGSYTAVIRGKNNTTGIALVEVYQIP